MTVHSIILLLSAATLTALIARRLHVPYTVGLVVVGAVLAVLHLRTGAVLTRNLLFNALLPPLLFEAAICLRWKDLRENASPILVLATAGVIISALIVAAGMTYIVHWPWQAALIFGTLIAATDPVSVLATFKETGVGGRLRLLVEAESLLNDGVAAVLFGVVVSLAMKSSTSGNMTLPLGESLAWTILAGIGIGAVSGGIGVILAGRPTADYLVETALTALAAYGSFWIATSCHASGVLATVTAGIVMGNVGALHLDSSQFFSERGREVVQSFWDFAAFVANSIVFLLIGQGNAGISFQTIGLTAIVAAVVLVWVGRAASVYPLSAIFSHSHLKVGRVDQHALFWGGLRGALALALALSLPMALPMRNSIIITTFSVVVFSIVVQGIAMPLLLRYWKLIPSNQEAAASDQSVVH